MSFLFRNKEVHADSTDRKYIIQYGVVPSTSEVASGIETMETNPLDGCVIKAQFAHPFEGTVNFHNYVCAPYSIPYSLLSTPLSALQGTSFRKFRHNFFRMNIAEPGTVWIFDRPSVDAWLNNTDTGIRFARDSGAFVGVMLDLEAYSSSIFWKYSSQSSSKTFAQYQAQIKALAREAMARWQAIWPSCEFVYAVGYEQLNGVATASLSSNTYGLLPSFLDGLYDTIKEPGTLTNYMEDGYPNQLQAWFDADIEIQLEANAPHLGARNYPYAHRNGMALWIDYNGSGWDNADDTNNYFTAALWSTSLARGLAATDKYLFVYNQQVIWPGFPQSSAVEDDILAIYITTQETARETYGLETAWRPWLVPNCEAWFDISSLSGTYSDTDPIDQWDDETGDHSGTQSSGARPTYDVDAFGTGFPGIDYDLASTQYFAVNSLGAPFSGTNLPFTFFFVGKADSGAPAGNVRMAGLGANGSSNPNLAFGQSSASKKWVVAKASNTGTSAQASTDVLADASNVIISNFVFCAHSDGSKVTIRINGAIAQISSANTFAQEVGAQTFDQAALGAAANNTINAHWDGKGGSMGFFTRNLGLDEIEKVERYLAIQSDVTLS